MKHLFSYGVWLAAIASFVLLFIEPNHPYVSYANNVISIYEIFSWVVCFLLAISTLLFGIAQFNKKGITKTGTPEQFKSLIESMKQEKIHQVIVRYLHYLFILFIGVFVGDMSVTFVLTVNALLFVLMKKFIRNLLKEAAADE